MNTETSSSKGHSEAVVTGPAKRPRLQFTLVRMFVIVAILALVAATLGRFALWTLGERHFKQTLKDHQAAYGRESTTLVFKRGATDESLEIIDRINIDIAMLVVLSDTQITDNGLEALKSLARIRELRLRNTKITGAGLKHLHAFDSLKTLDLSDSQVTDKGLNSLSGLQHVEWLSLNGTGISDDALKHVGTMRSLRFLWLVNTKLTAQGFHHLASCPNLDGIWIDPAHISPETLQELRSIPRLTGVTIVGDIADDELVKIREVLDPVSVGLSPAR